MTRASAVVKRQLAFRLDRESMAVPFASLGLQNATAGARIPFAIRRCDIGNNGKHACGGFGEGKTRGELVLDGALLAEAQASARP